MGAAGSIAGKSVLISGASHGLGAALAGEFARRGARLTLLARTGDELEAVADRCRRTGGDAIAVTGDVTSGDDCRRAVVAAVDRHGGLDILIANAGLSMWTPFEQVESTDVLRRLMDVNYMGAVNCIQAGLPQLRRTQGMIVAITSIQAKIGVPQHTGYVASKHALQGFCDALRLELEESGVGVLTVMPHWLRGTQLRRHALGGDGGPLGESSRKHSSESVALDTAGRAIVEAALRRRRDLVIPWKLKLLLWLNMARPIWAEGIIKRAMTGQKGH